MAHGSRSMTETSVRTSSRRHQPSAISHVAAATLGVMLVVAALRAADPPLPELTEPVNDFAHVIDSASASEIDRMSRALQAKTGDVVVVATVPTIEPYGSVEQYAVKMFENRGRGIGDKAKDNGVLILLAMKERRVRVEVGYGLEQWITDGFAGETSRQGIAPEVDGGRYGNGPRLGTGVICGGTGPGRGVSLEGVSISGTGGQRGNEPVQ